MARPGSTPWWTARPPRSEAGYVPSAAHGLALERIDRFVDAAQYLGHPGQAVLQDPLHSTLEGGGADCTGAARSLELDLDHPGDHVRREEGEIAAIGLDGWPHELGEGTGLCNTPP